jgi:hypothetical protein
MGLKQGARVLNVFAAILFAFLFASSPQNLFAEDNPEAPTLKVVVRSMSDSVEPGEIEIEMEDVRDPHSAMSVSYVTGMDGNVIFNPKDFEGFQMKEIQHGQTETVRYNGDNLDPTGNFKVRLRVRAPEKVEKEFIVQVPANETITYTAEV